MTLKQRLGRRISPEAKRRARHYRALAVGEHELNWYERADRDEFLRKALKVVSFNRITGDYVEFGCCGALTFTLADKHMKRYNAPRHQWAFDSF